MPLGTVRYVAGSLLAFTLAACGSSASAIRQTSPTVGDVMQDDHGGGSCQGVDKPLVVDANPELRADLEVAMGKGIAVVAYDCKKIRILTCKAPGDYTYSGFTTKEQVISLENADEIRANLPLSGAGLAAKMEGDLAKGVTLDIAMAMVGKKSSTTEVSRASLQGDCKDATHFVRGAMVGAFAMQTGTKAKVKAAADILGQGASAESSSGLKIGNKDGTLDECKKATPDDLHPRAQCASLIRLELVAIDKPASASAESSEATAQKPPEPDADTHSCPGGLKWIDGKCGTPGGNGAHACVDTDFADCDQQCHNGNYDSCNTLGVLQQRGGKDRKSDPAAAVAAFDAACSHGIPGACTNLAGIYQWGSQAVPKDLDKAQKYGTQACNAGDGRGCSALASIAWSSQSDDDKAKAGPALVRACNAGYAIGCWDLGNKLLGPLREKLGKPFLASQPSGIVYLGKACKAGQLYSCMGVGDSYVNGAGVTKDPLKAIEFYALGCDGGNAPDACVREGILYENGILSKDETKAAAFYKKGCEMVGTNGKPVYGAPKACVYLGRLFERGAGVGKEDDVQAASLYKKACDTDEKYGRSDGCVDLARIYETGKGAPKNLDRAFEILQYGCNNNNAPACYALGERYLTGKGLPKAEKKDDAKAAGLLGRGCGSSPEACTELAKMSAQGKGGLKTGDSAVAMFYLRACVASSNFEVDLVSSPLIGQACARIAAAEASGKGVNKSEPSAFDHFTRACNRGDKPSCDQAKKLAPK